MARAFLLLLSLLAACGSTAGRLVEAEPGATWTQSSSGAAFPPRIGAFERLRVELFAQDGSDVAVSYQSARSPCLCTVYVFPRREETAAHFERSLARILERHPGAEVDGARDRVPAVGDQPDRAARIVHDADLGGETPEQVVSFLLLMPRGDWFVKVRATCPAAVEQEVLRDLAVLLARLPRPGGPPQASR